MSMYASGPRRLSWELQRALTDRRTTEDDGECSPSSFVWPENSDERTLVLFELSLNEYNVLASAIDVGSDIAYGEDAIRVNDLWLRNMRCEVSICDAIIQAIQTCPELQDELIGFIGNAIGSNAIVQEQLRTFVVGDALIRGYVQTTSQEDALSPATRSQNLLREAVCTDPELYNQAVVIAQTLATMSENFFAAVNTSIDIAEAVTAVLSVVPWTGVSLGASAVELLADALWTTFQAAYTSGAGSVDTAQLYCDLWCELREDCSFSIDQLIGFYAARTTLSINTDPAEAMLGIIGAISGGGLVGEAAYFAMHTFMLACVRVSQDILGVDFGSFAQTVRNAGTTPNNGYLSCDPCQDPSCFDPDNFHVGTVTDQDGLEYTVEGEDGLTIVWGQNDMDGPVCELESFELLDGFIQSGTMLDEFLVSRSFADLPLRIRYLDMAAGATPMIVRFNFT